MGSIIRHLGLVLLVTSSLYSPLAYADGPTVLVRSGSVTKVLSVSMANTPASRSLGLMYRKSLAEEEGMYFLFEQVARQTFWMKNVLFPLDIIFVDDAGRIVSIARKAPPCATEPCPLYRSGKPVRAVLEVRGGWCDKYGVREGGRVEYRP